MPKILVDAHHAFDKAVDLCYRRERFKSELERLEFFCVVPSIHRADVNGDGEET